MSETRPLSAAPDAASRPALRSAASAVLAAILVVSLIPLALGVLTGIASGAIADTFFYALFLVLPANLGVMGVVLTRRRPGNRIGWLLLVSGTLAAISLAAGEFGRAAVSSGQPDAPLVPLAVWLGSWGFIPAVGVLVVFLPLLYPTGRLLGPRWRIVVAVAVVGITIGALGAAIVPGPMGEGGPRNPFGAPEPWLSPIEAIAGASNLVAAPVFLLSLTSLLLRFRRSTGIERQQIKWFLFVATFATIAFAVSVAGSGPFSDAAWTIGLVTLAALPVAIGLAILRYGLYEIDRIVNRTLVYGAVTAILAGVFAAATALSQRVFIDVAGQTSDGAIVLTTLVVVAVYAPVRKRVEGVVDRWFKYDQRAYGPYLDELRRLLDLVEPHRAAGRLAREAMVHTGATGIAVVGPGGVVATAGRWPAEPSVAVPIEVEGSPLTEVLVGPRRDGKSHPSARLRELADAAAVAALAVSEREVDTRR